MVEEEGEEGIMDNKINETNKYNKNDKIDNYDETNDSNETNDSDKTNESNESNDSNEDDDTTSTIVAGVSQSNQLSEYVKEKHSRLREWRQWLMEVRVLEHRSMEGRHICVRMRSIAS